ncbi:MAG: hypothetical protein M3494_09100 [Actinomycetota bacterium]|nr:hypothetical protein [Rubrobacter sp.]MDQ3508157.1 hypothetical protein [Actinomycetota bacterium]
MNSPSDEGRESGGRVAPPASGVGGRGGWDVGIFLVEAPGRVRGSLRSGNVEEMDIGDAPASGFRLAGSGGNGARSGRPGFV